MPVFIVQVTELVQFTQYNTFSKIPPSISMHFATRVRTWRVARLYYNGSLLPRLLLRYLPRCLALLHDERCCRCSARRVAALPYVVISGFLGLLIELILSL
jgi:hypothetical protein